MRCIISLSYLCFIPGTPPQREGALEGYPCQPPQLCWPLLLCIRVIHTIFYKSTPLIKCEKTESRLTVHSLFTLLSSVSNSILFDIKLFVLVCTCDHSVFTKLIHFNQRTLSPRNTCISLPRIGRCRRKLHLSNYHLPEVSSSCTCVSFSSILPQAALIFPSHYFPFSLCSTLDSDG